MTTQPCETFVRHQPQVTTIDLHGEINSFAEDALNEAYAQAENFDPATIALNFSDVRYINSTGIALIVGLLAKARKSKRKMVVFGLSDHYEEIFRITRLSDFMTIYLDESSALTGV